MSQSVADYYAGKSIFITGATGFVGKLFNPLREKQPDVFQKLKLVAGDILEDDMCLSNDDREELQKNCNVVFHSAACVRFDQKLKDAVNLNTTAVLRVLKLAEKMENLEVFVHLSTAYCRCDIDVLEEKLYPAVHKPAWIMNIVNWMDDDLLDYLEPKLIASEPNTYAYTKAISEDLVAEYGKKFPVAIARPSIVTAALKEPIPGWVDNLNGPTGLIIGSGKGVIRTMHCEPSYLADAMPVDVVVNACILLAFATAVDKPRDARFYNITLSGQLRCTWGEMIYLGEKWLNKFPPTVALWYIGGSIKSYWLTHQFHMFFTHLVPAYLIDMILYLVGHKTFMVKVQKRVSHGLNVLQYYTTKEWDFRNTNFNSLRQHISESDNEVFFTDVSGVDVDDYLKNYMIGAREYCCKEDPSNLERARKIHKIRYAVDKITKTFLYGLLVWFLYSYSHFFTMFLEYLDCAMKSISPIDNVRADEVEEIK